MPHPLDGIRSKIERANEQIRNLSAEIDDFTNKTYTIVPKDHPTEDRRDYILEIGPGESTGLERMGLIAGEIIHHLRSCFDHLVWKLIEANHIDPEKVTSPRPEFPIFLDSNKYAVEGAKKVQKTITSAQPLIEQLQPYNGEGDRDPLWFIHRLDVIDKHRVLLATSIFPKHETINETLSGLKETIINIRGWLYDAKTGTCIASFRRSTMNNLKLNFRVDIMLTEARGSRQHTVVEFLANLTEFTSRTMNLFDPLV